jgi:hypothetical protein
MTHRTAIVFLLLAQAAQGQSIGEKSLALLKTRCYACHGTKRDDWDASNRESIRRTQDSILEMIDTDIMPPGKLTKLSAAEKAMLRSWFGEGTKAAASPPAVPQTLDDAWVVRQIEADQRRRDDSLYLSLANLQNAGATKQQVWDAQGAVSKAVNLLSTSPRIVVPAKVDQGGILLRVETSLLGWDANDVAALLNEYPYGFSRRVFLRGDWFVARALRAPLYYRLLGVPETQRELDATLGVDRQRFIDRNIVRRAAITNSRVAFHNRAIEWAPANTGAVRLTYDTANETADRRIVTSPLAFRHDAVEYIADLPNGLHLYAAFNAQGQRQNKVPEDIASDPSQFSGSTAIVPGISCACCHQTGIQSPVTDVVRDGAPLFSVGELAKVQSLYPTKEQFAATMARDESRYLTAVRKATQPFKAIDEPIGPTVLEYNRPLDLKRAALEANASEARLRTAVQADGTLQTLGLRPLIEGQTITRDTWENVDGASPAQRVAQLLGR